MNVPDVLAVVVDLSWKVSRMETAAPVVGVEVWLGGGRMRDGGDSGVRTV